MSANGTGSLEYIKDVVSTIEMQDAEPMEDINENDIPWCKCRKCRLMPKEKENKCCGRWPCVSTYQIFAKVCLDRDVLDVAIKTRNDFRAEDIEFTTDSYRHAAYRQFIMWKYGRLGREDRRVIPSCCVWKIRNAYPSPDGVYTGFKEKRT